MQSQTVCHALTLLSDAGHQLHGLCTKHLCLSRGKCFPSKIFAQYSTITEKHFKTALFQASWTACSDAPVYNFKQDSKGCMQQGHTKHFDLSSCKLQCCRQFNHHHYQYTNIKRIVLMDSHDVAHRLSYFEWQKIRCRYCDVFLSAMDGNHDWILLALRVQDAVTKSSSSTLLKYFLLENCTKSEKCFSVESATYNSLFRKTSEFTCFIFSRPECILYVESMTFALGCSYYGPLH